MIVLVNVLSDGVEVFLFTHFGACHLSLMVKLTIKYKGRVPKNL